MITSPRRNSRVLSKGLLVLNLAALCLMVVTLYACGASATAVNDDDDDVTTPNPPNPNLEEWRPNEPSDWTTRSSHDFVGSTVEPAPDPAWFTISNVAPGSMSGPYGTNGTPPGQDASPFMDAEAQSPVSASGLVFFYPEGLVDGQTNGHFGPSFATSDGGVYYAYTFHTSANWQQSETVVTGNTFKHVETRARTGSSGGGQLIARTGITKIPSDPQNRYRMKLADWISSTDATYTNDEAGYWQAGDWVIVEVLIRYNSGGANTGSMQLWVNGSLQAYLDPHDIPYDQASGITASLVHGGGIGSSQVDKYMTFGDFYVATPP